MHEAALATLTAGVEHQLLDNAQRALRAPDGRSALALHLSRLAPPAPRPHHRRVARALLTEAAAANEGQIYPLRNGDLVLLCRGAVAPLAATCARLFHIDAPDPATLITAWSLDRDGDALVRFAAERLADPPPPPPEPEPASSPEAVDAVAGLIDGTALGNLVQRQTAVLLTPGGGAGAMRPLFREVTFSMAALEARLAVAGQTQADPFLFRHLAGRLDRRMLGALLQDGGLDTPLGAQGADRQALHLNLTLAGALSPDFGALAALARANGVRLGVEISVLEAFADPGAFRRLREALRDASVTLALDGVSHHALAVTHPELLDADLLKLNWHPAFPDAGLDEALQRLGPDRLLLQRAESEAAIAWGVSHRIHRFQGQQVDNMLAALRLRACPSGRSCTLRQCAERSSATSRAGRAGCRNHPLLDAAAP